MHLPFRFGSVISSRVLNGNNVERLRPIHALGSSARANDCDADLPARAPVDQHI